MRYIYPQTRKHMHDCLSCVSQYRESLWCFKYVLFIPGLPYDTWLITGGDETSKTLGFQPTAHGLPPMMLKPRDPPSRRRTTVMLLVSSSYRQTEERHVSKKTAGGNL